ncbi:MAG: ferric reductase-like transmembrane domain-containing protein [Actinomycetota bacterium]
MTDEFTWYVTRATGLVSWALLAAATIWGLLLTSRLLERRPSPAWLLDLHRHLGNLTLALTVIHVAAIALDDFVDYTIAELLVPFISDHDAVAVGLGVISLWLLAVVQVTSWARRRLDQRLWRRAHLLSAPLVILATLHGWMIGTDLGNPIVIVVGLVLAAEILVITALRLRYGRRELPRAIHMADQPA